MKSMLVLIAILFSTQSFANNCMDDFFKLKILYQFDSQIEGKIYEDERKKLSVSDICIADTMDMIQYEINWYVSQNNKYQKEMSAYSMIIDSELVYFPEKASMEQVCGSLKKQQDYLKYRPEDLAKVSSFPIKSNWKEYCAFAAEAALNKGKR